jgi:hypothetical protein
MVSETDGYGVKVYAALQAHHGGTHILQLDLHHVCVCVSVCAHVCMCVFVCLCEQTIMRNLDLQRGNTSASGKQRGEQRDGQGERQTY